MALFIEFSSVTATSIFWVFPFMIFWGWFLTFFLVKTIFIFRLLFPSLQLHSFYRFPSIDSLFFCKLYQACLFVRLKNCFQMLTIHTIFYFLPLIIWHMLYQFWLGQTAEISTFNLLFFNNLKLFYRCFISIILIAVGFLVLYAVSSILWMGIWETRHCLLSIFSNIYDKCSEVMYWTWYANTKILHTFFPEVDLVPRFLISLDAMHCYTVLNKTFHH